jgi:hypothetical protein
MEINPIPGTGSDEHRPENTSQEAQSADMRSKHFEEMPLRGSLPDQASHYLDRAFEDARAVATLLVPLMETGSAMEGFARDGQVQIEHLLRECQVLRQGAHQTADVPNWVDRLEAYLASLGPIGTGDAPSRADELTSEAELGSAEYGDAFRAYLGLPDIDPARSDLIETFHEFYVASYASMDDLLNDMTEVQEWEAAVDQLAQTHGIDGFISLDRSKVEHVARETWDIVEIGGRLHAFLK